MKELFSKVVQGLKELRFKKIEPKTPEEAQANLDDFAKNIFLRNAVIEIIGDGGIPQGKISPETALETLRNSPHEIKLQVLEKIQDWLMSAFGRDKEYSKEMIDAAMEKTKQAVHLSQE